MARLIDANEARRRIIAFATGLHSEVLSVDTVMMLLTQAPTVEAVEVIRCRDCAKDGLFTCPICFIENKELYFINHSPDFYCGEGERKDGDGNGKA